MWLVYLRFDDHGRVITYHIRTGSNREALEIVAMAEKHGLTPNSTFVEYAAFAVSGEAEIKPMIRPIGHFYEHEEFVERWQETDQAIERMDAAIKELLLAMQQPPLDVYY